MCIYYTFVDRITVLGLLLYHRLRARRLALKVCFVAPRQRRPRSLPNEWSGNKGELRGSKVKNTVGVSLCCLPVPVPVCVCVSCVCLFGAFLKGDNLAVEHQRARCETECCTRGWVRIGVRVGVRVGLRILFG